MASEVGANDSEWIYSEVAAELLFGSVGKDPDSDRITEAGCHAIKRTIIQYDQSKDGILYDSINLENVETQAISHDVWKVSGKYLDDGQNPFSHWKVALRVVDRVIDGVDHLIYEPTEVWTGDNLNRLVWKK